MRIFLFLTVLFILTGCSKKITPTNSQSEVIQLESDTWTQQRDTVIKTPAAEASINVPLKDISSALKADSVVNRNATVKFFIIDRESSKPFLQIDCKCDTLSIIAKLKDNYRRDYQKVTITNTIVKPVKYTPWFVKILAWVGGITLATLIVITILKIKKAI